MKSRAPAKGQAPQPLPEGSTVPPNHYPLFKGATRVATIKGGVPTRAFVGLVMVVVIVAMFTLYGWLLFPILYPVMAVISRQDDRAFWTWELWLKTKFLARNKRYWSAVSYSPLAYSRRRPWARRLITRYR